MTIAFDFSVGEIWVPWMVGATLVPKPAGSSLLGMDLHEFLTARRVTAMCCVPTLLATLEEDLPALRFLLVSGAACPQDLVARWHRPGRRFLNVYGPTEATVTATWTCLHPDRPVTIGVPLPTYTTVILDPDDPRKALPHGVVGEIGIAGIGLASGYVNRQDLTARAGAAPQQAHVAPTTNTERILAEALAGVLRLEQVSVEGHFFDDLGASSLLLAQFCARVRKNPDLPSVSMKDVYLHPTIRSLAAFLGDTAPTTPPPVPARSRSRRGAARRC